MSRWATARLTAIESSMSCLAAIPKMPKVRCGVSASASGRRSSCVAIPDQDCDFQQQREREHILLNRLHEYTKMKVPSHFFGSTPDSSERPAMIIERIIGCTGAPPPVQKRRLCRRCGEIARQLCEQTALHTLPSAPERRNLFNDPGVGAHTTPGSSTSIR